MITFKSYNITPNFKNNTRHKTQLYLQFIKETNQKIEKYFFKKIS